MTSPTTPSGETAPGGETASGGGSAGLPQDELAIVLSHYDLGVISKMQVLRRGTADSTKYVIRSERGDFLLKRRREGRDDLARIAYSHAVHVALLKQSFPTPVIVGTRRSNNSAVVHAGLVYELLRWIPGHRFSGSVGETLEAGRMLARFHDALVSFREMEPPTSIGGSYHAVAGVETELNAMSVGRNREIAEAASALRDLYAESAERAEAAGIASWPVQVVHGDWHPGNLLYSEGRVVGVLDLDTVRPGTRALDLATGALQFSITRTEGNPLTWPDSIDEVRYRAFLDGYDETSERRISRAELGVLAWLMIEAMIAESVVPVATTGRFAAVEGGEFLGMVRRKAEWIRDHGMRLEGILDEHPQGGAEKHKDDPAA